MFYNNQLKLVVDKYSNSISRLMKLDLIPQLEVDNLEDITKFELNTKKELHINEHVLDLAHHLAFDNKGYGNRLNDVIQIRKDEVLKFVKNVLTPENIILCCSGQDSEKVFNMINDSFDLWSLKSQLQKKEGDQSIVDNTSNEYKGGVRVITEKTKDDLVHCYIGLEGLPLGSKEYHTLAVIQTMMGGGSSFSAGGPGKGMQSRLYQRVLNTYGFVESCQFMLNCYKKKGLFGLTGSTKANKTYDLIYILLKSMVDLTGEISDIEFVRSKNQLKHNYLMNLEYQQNFIEDAANQVMVYNKLHDPMYLCEIVDNVTRQDIKDVVIKILGSQQFTLLLYGNASKLDMAMVNKVLKFFGVDLK